MFFQQNSAILESLVFSFQFFETYDLMNEFDIVVRNHILVCSLWVFREQADGLFTRIDNWVSNRSALKIRFNLKSIYNRILTS